MVLEDFIHHYVSNAPQIMWFLGAGSSRSAGMASATDIIWDLKRKYYCVKENRDITDNELSNEAIKGKIQSYLESNGCPSMGSEEEYSLYFKLVFGDNPAQHQKYLEEKLNPELISINSGHRILAALLAMNKSKIVFTTNFDSVLERAYAIIAEKDLHPFSLDGSYAALNALNNEVFPLYAKMHGDFRYFEMKNLPEQLLDNDKEIEKCFINACSRYGLIVNGYSGRDKNVMAAFEAAIDQMNAFPKGLFWLTSVNGNIFPAVNNLIEKAQQKGISAHVIPSDTFDTLLVKIWKQIDNKPKQLDEKIRRSAYTVPKIDRFPDNGNYPVLRFNTFPVLSVPTSCLSIETLTPWTNTDFKSRLKVAKSSAIVVKERTILAWGEDAQVFKIIPEAEIKSKSMVTLDKNVLAMKESTVLHSFLYRALCFALTKDKPLRLLKRFGKFYAVVSTKHPKYGEVELILKNALKKWDYNQKKMLPPAALAGKIPNTEGTFWMEAVELSFELIDNKFWLVLNPDIWIEPGHNRKDVVDFLREKRRFRYNQVQNLLIDAWAKILMGDEKTVSLKPFDQSVNNNPEFTISKTTGYSKRSGL